jgi:hypothetical protein
MQDSELRKYAQKKFFGRDTLRDFGINGGTVQKERSK